MSHEVFQEILQELNNQHFSRIANQYRLLRTTDLEPILTIASYLKHSWNLRIVDVGCGAGRYDRLLFSALSDNIEHLSCVDLNPHMLNELKEYLEEKGIDRFSTWNAPAEELPFPDDSQDVIISFNALHHFRLEDAFWEFVRVLKDGGWMFLYTRTPEQNQNSIWGQYFPKFNEKEQRLKDLNTIEHIIMNIKDIELTEMKFFTYRRKDSLERLVNKARNCHYSTFALYDEDELDEAIQEFKKNILVNFKDPKNICWIDRNVMIIARKRQHLKSVSPK